MKDTRKNRVWSLVGALALAAGVASNRVLTHREAELSAGNAIISGNEELHDAVASPATAGLAGKPVPTSWFKTPSEHHAEIETALLGSRQRRRADRRVALQ